MYRIIFSKRADQDKALLKAAGLEKNAHDLLAVLREDPYKNPPPYEKLKGNLEGLYSRRINIRHRLVYDVNADVVHVLRMWSHYE